MVAEIQELFKTIMNHDELYLNIVLASLATYTAIGLGLFSMAILSKKASK